MYIVKVIKELAEQYGVTNLAEQLGSTRPTVYGWLQGKVLPNIATVPKIAELSGISADVLLSENGLPIGLNKAATPVYSLDDIDNPDAVHIGMIEPPASVASEYPNGKFYRLTTDSINKYAPYGSIALIDHANTACNGLIVAKMNDNIVVGVCHCGASQVMITPATYTKGVQDKIAPLEDVSIMGKIIFYMGYTELQTKQRW